MKSALASCALALVSTCRRPPPPDPHTPEGTLALLRQSLATGTPPIDSVADRHVQIVSRVLYEGRDLQQSAGDVMNAPTFQQHVNDAEPHARPEVLFRGDLAMLGAGHCTRIGDTSIPPELTQAAEPLGQWPTAMLDATHDVARKLVRQVAGDFRCDPGLSFGVVFVRPIPDDGTLRVAYIGPARHR